MLTPCNNAAYLAELCAGHEKIVQANEKSNFFIICVVGAVFVAACLFVHLESQKVKALVHKIDSDNR